MRYLGGKSKIASQIAAVISRGRGWSNHLVEPFVGGCGATASLARYFDTVSAHDVNPDVIILWQELMRGWEPPAEISEQEYNMLKLASPSAVRSFAGFGCSWGGKWFGGYARGGDRNYADETRRGLINYRARLKNVSFILSDYGACAVSDGDTVYADPPYRGTTGYSSGVWDPARFYLTAERWATAGAKVFVSEYEVRRDNWVVAWEQTRTRDMRADVKTAVKVTERLYELRGF